MTLIVIGPAWVVSFHPPDCPCGVVQEKVADVVCKPVFNEMRQISKNLNAQRDKEWPEGY